MELFVADAFTTRRFSGNQAGVALLGEADFPEEGFMRALAGELKHSETAFVRRTGEGSFHIRYFTPAEEVDLCGHATIASFTVLRERRAIGPGTYALHTRSGDLSIQVGADAVWMDMAPPADGRSFSEEEQAELYAAYGLSLADRPEGLEAQAVSTGLEWHWRGNASYFADKKSYRLNLMDESGAADAQDLLGLGSDADWILLNLATDVTRVRDKVVNDLWGQMSAAYDFDPAGATCEYVELYLNGEYMGVYLLCTTVDRELLDLEGGDRLYKYRQGVMAYDEEYDQLEEDQSLQWLNKLEVVWPQRWTEGVWEPMRSYAEAFFWPDTETDTEHLEQTANIDNLIDVALFKQFICAIDNSYHNMYYMYRADEGQFYRIPWDLNYVWGDTHEGMFELDFTTLIIPDMELNRLYETDPEGTVDRVARRWGVDYAIRPVDKGKYLLLFKANQADAITGCFSEYSRRMLARTKKGRAPVLEQMEQAQEQVRQQPHRQREREKEVAAEDR